MKRLYGVCAVVATGFLGCFVEANSPPAKISQNMTPPPPILIASPQGAAIACPCPAVALRGRADSMPNVHVHEGKVACEANVKTAPSSATAAASQGSPHAISKPIPIPLARSQSVTPREATPYGATVFTSHASPLNKFLSGQQSPAAVVREAMEFKKMITLLQRSHEGLTNTLMERKSMQGSWSKPQHTRDYNELAELAKQMGALLAKYQ